MSVVSESSGFATAERANRSRADAARPRGGGREQGLQLERSREPAAAGAAAGFFSSSLEHLLAELERLDLLIRILVERERERYRRDHEFRGLCISELEVDALLARSAGLPGWAADDAGGERASVGDLLEPLTRRITERRRASLRRGVPLRLEELRRLFDLSAFEVDALLICLAPELDLRYERLFAYLHDDLTRKRPSVDLVLNLLCPTLEEKLARRQRFLDTAPLRRHGLLELFEDPASPRAPLLACCLKVDDRVAAYLVGSDELDPRLRTYGRKIEPTAVLEGLVLPGGLEASLRAVATSPGISDPGSLLYFRGPYGVGKATAAEALCGGMGRRLLTIDLEPLSAVDDDGFLAVLELAIREAALQRAAIYWQGFDALLAEEQSRRRHLFVERLQEVGGPSFLAGSELWEPRDRGRGGACLRFDFPVPVERERGEIWRRVLGSDVAGGQQDLDDLAARFRLSGGQIQDAAATARDLARRRDPSNGRPTRADLYSACRLQSNRTLAVMAQKIDPHYGWDDIVLPADQLEQLREICNWVKFRGRVLDDWGFGRKLSLGKGLNVLFSGPSGTGKTMAAEVLAQELSLDLYRIDLSTVMSKYIGETEKNLARIFREAETSNAILFFDEADALFGKRSKVRDSHDRYANIEISYLLTKMEEHEGLTILATNLRRNMDGAFVRRMTFTMHFPLPKKEDRIRIWEGIWPVETPRQADLDLMSPATHLNLAGANIRNIALTAAFKAAATSQEISNDLLLRAIGRELQKIGKTVNVARKDALETRPNKGYVDESAKQAQG